MTDTGKQALAALIDSDLGVYTTGGFTTGEGPGLHLISPVGGQLNGSARAAGEGQHGAAVAPARAAVNARAGGDAGAHRAEVGRLVPHLVGDNREPIAYVDGTEAGKGFADRRP